MELSQFAIEYFVSTPMYTLSKLTPSARSSIRCIYEMEQRIHFSLISLDRISFRAYGFHSNVGMPIAIPPEWGEHNSPFPLLALQTFPNLPVYMI